MSSNRFQIVIVGGGIVGTFLASTLAAKGVRVALIEKGREAFAGHGLPTPLIEYPEREHIGSTKARNHVLGGNGHYWGGGLVRPPSTRLGDVLGISASSDHAFEENLADHYSAVEKEFGLSAGPKRSTLQPDADGLGPIDISEILVLPGKSRNVSARALARIRSSSFCSVFANSQLVRFNRDQTSRVKSVDLKIEGEPAEIAADAFVITAGTIDTNLILLSHRQELALDHVDELGQRLHDHISVPLFEVDGLASKSLRRLLAPTFRDGAVIGKRFELQPNDNGGAGGFLHFQFLFDEVAPYREIKQVMSLRQKQAGIAALATSILQTAVHLPKLGRIGLERYMFQRLHIDEAVPTIATVDYESEPSTANRIELTPAGNAKLHWDIREADEITFAALAGHVKHLMSQLEHRFSATARPVADLVSPSGRVHHLRDCGVDAYHLGGGIPFGRALDWDLRLQGIDNVFVISSAVMQKAGIANPVLTLLALANRFANGRAYHRRDLHS